MLGIYLWVHIVPDARQLEITAAGNGLRPQSHHTANAVAGKPIWQQLDVITHPDLFRTLRSIPWHSGGWFKDSIAIIITLI